MDIITMNSARVFIVKGSVRRYHEIKGGFPMAILFSKATLASGGSSITFLIAGAPSTVEGFDGWTAYHSFIEGLPAGTEVQVRITAYMYGERDVVVATPEEVAYIDMRIRMRPNFLENRCQMYAEIDFSFTRE